MSPATRICSVLVLACLASPAAATTYTVANTNDSGANSLRAAITSANGVAGPHRIVFAIPLGGVQTIHLLTPLPAIHNKTAIDAKTQFQYNGTPLIELEGSGLPAMSVGIRFDTNADGSRLSGFTLNRFSSNAVWVEADACTLSSNWIGLNSAGAAASANAGNGVLLTGSHNVVGGHQPPLRNVISGNTLAGVSVSSSCCDTILANYIGLNPTGTAAIANQTSGIQMLDATQVVIGGPAAADGNVISGNNVHGILFNGTFEYSFADATRIFNNYIGTNAVGTLAVGNGMDGINVNTSRTLIGDIGMGNVISGNKKRGVVVNGGASRANELYANKIGVTSDGTRPLGNTNEGVHLSNSPGNFVGGNLTNGSGNLIGANGGAGVKIDGFDAINNVIEGNAIGTSFNGALALGNGRAGVYTASDFTRIGQPGDLANIISRNHAAGVQINSFQNPVEGNSIFANDSLGVDLLDNTGGPVTPNDSLDNDAGPNFFQNYPVLTSVTFLGNQIRLQGRYSSETNSIFTIDFYNNRQCDASGYGEGELYLGTTQVTTNALGLALFDVTFFDPPLVGWGFCCTATDFLNDTSEFSPCATIATPTAADPAPAVPFALGYAAPAPARGRTSLPFTLARRSHVSLRAYDVSGRLVASVLEGDLPAGPHHADWTVAGLGAGVYFCRLVAQANDGSGQRFEASRRVVVIR